MKPNRNGNPIREARERMGLNMVRFAGVADVSYGTIGAVELGKTPRVPRKILDALVVLGADENIIVNAYADWRRRQGLAKDENDEGGQTG